MLGPVRQCISPLLLHPVLPPAMLVHLLLSAEFGCAPTDPLLCITLLGPLLVLLLYRWLAPTPASMLFDSISPEADCVHTTKDGPCITAPTSARSLYLLPYDVQPHVQSLNRRVSF